MVAMRLKRCLATKSPRNETIPLILGNTRRTRKNKYYWNAKSYRINIVSMSLDIKIQLVEILTRFYFFVEII